MRRWGILTTALFLTLAACDSASHPVQKKPMFSATDRANIIAKVQEAQNNGLIKKLDADLDKAWISELTWVSIDSEVKENMARVLAAYCAIQKNIEYLSVDIIGWQSGKKLASYSSFGGFKVY